MNQPGEVANPARGQLNIRENEYLFPCPRILLGIHLPFICHQSVKKPNTYGEGDLSVHTVFFHHHTLFLSRTAQRRPAAIYATVWLEPQ